MSTLTLLNGLLRVASCGGPLVLSPKSGSSDPCCCDPPACPCTSYYEETNYSYTEDTGSLGPFCSFTYIKGEETITIPSYISLPCTVTLSGDINDDLLLNGDVVGDDRPTGFGSCNGAGYVCHRFVANSRTFTLATKDNYGFGMSANITVRFCRD